MASRLELHLLGDFRAAIDGRPLPPESWRQRRAASLVKLLALAPRHRLARDEVIEALWPGMPPAAGASNVRKAVHLARRTLGERAIAVASGAVELWPAGELAIDVDEFEAASAAALESGDAMALLDSIDRYPGELLPDDRFEPWSEDRRREVRERFLMLLRRAGLWQRVADLEPTDEEAHRELMRAHLATGNRQAAIRQFERLREVLREELGVGPDPLSVELYERVLASEGREAPTAAERIRAMGQFSELLNSFDRDYEHPRDNRSPSNDRR